MANGVFAAKENLSCAQSEQQILIIIIHGDSPHQKNKNKMKLLMHGFQSCWCSVASKRPIFSLSSVITSLLRSKAPIFLLELST